MTDLLAWGWRNDRWAVAIPALVIAAVFVAGIIGEVL